MADLQFPHRSNGFKSKAKNVSATDTGKIADGHDYGGRNGYDVVFGEPPKFIVPSFTSEIDDYSEIFRSFSSSKYCSVPILEFPVHEAENGEVSGGSLSSTFAYSDIFGGLDGDVAVPYEELFGEPKGSRNQCRVPPDSKEEGVSGEIPSKNIWIPVETKSWHQSPAVVPNVSLEESKAETFDSLEKNSFSLSVSSHYLQDGVKQHNMPSQNTNQRNKEDAINGTTHISQPNVVCGFTVDPCAPLLSTGSDQTLPQIIDDLSLTMDFTVESLEEKTRRAMPPNPARNNFLKSSLGSKFPAVEEVPSYVNDQQHLHDSPHDLTCGGDKYNRNGTFLKVSDINLWTEPTRVPPPSRPPPKLVTKWGVSEKLMAANLKASGDKEDLHKPVMIYQHQQFGSASKTYIVEEVASQSSPPFLDVEIDASSAAMKEAMERAAARLKRAKHSMERKRDIKGRENGYIKGRERMGYQIDEENCRNKEDTALEVCEGEDRVTEDCARDERRKAEKTAQVQLELAQESTERNLVKDLRVGREAHEQGNRSGEWKAGEWEETEKKIKAAEEFFEQGKKEKKPNAAIEDCEREAREKKLAAAKDNREYGENVNKLKVAKDAHECKEYEKKSNASEDARQREANEKRLKAAQLAREQEENEEKLKAAQEAWEQKENEKKLQLAQEAREWEENRRELKLAQEACEREENERKQKFAQEVCAQEDNERKLKLAKEAREWEENERKLKLAQEAHERVENDKKLKLAQEAREREEYERKLQLAQEAHEREENERKLKLAQEARELEENERRLKLAQEAREREESERKLKLPQEAREQEENERKLKLAQEACKWEENERKLKFAQEPCEREGNEWKPKQAQEAPEQEESKRKIKLAQEAHKWDENGRKLKLAQEDSKWDKTEKKLDVAQWVRVWEEKNRISKLFQEICKSEGTERKGQTVNEAHEIEKHNKDQQEKLKLQHEREQEKERLRKIEEKEREREREKDRLAVERATCEAHERTFVEARERAERASSEAQERVSMEVILRAERAAVDRATAEVWERAMERVLSEEAAMEAREWAERSIAERIATALTDGQRKDNDLGEFVGNYAKTNGGMSYNPASSVFEHDLEFLSTVSSNESSQRNLDASNYGLHSIEKFQEAEGELSKRHKAKLERQQRTNERAAKALADKKLLDILLQREQAERNRLAETLDADVRRWSRGKEGNLRALLSTLQYILWPESGWQPVPLTDVITDAAVKKAYRKATFCVHPDKVQQRGASIQQKYISEKIFDLLKEAWNKFNSEER